MNNFLYLNRLRFLKKACCCLSAENVSCGDLVLFTARRYYCGEQLTLPKD